MYLNYTVDVPNVKGKIVVQKKGDTSYVMYETDRTYDPSVQYTTVKRIGIGKLNGEGKLIPNQNFLTYFPDVSHSEKSNVNRSSCLRTGSYILIDKIIKEYKIEELLSRKFSKADVGLFLDLVAYTIICENNAGQYYPDYAYNHPLFSDNMHIYSDSKVSEFLNSITDNQITGFLNDWNEKRNYRERIYISYDSTNKSCQAGDIEIVEDGKSKDNDDKPIFNYSIAYDTDNKEPLYYEEYCGSINDISQFKEMIEKAHGYGYKNIGFVLDRGYLSKSNIRAMDRHGYSFIIMMKGMANLVKELVTSVKGTFENDRDCCIHEFRLYGTTKEHLMWADDEKPRYFHIFYSDSKGCSDREAIDEKLYKMALVIKSKEFKKVSFDKTFQKYFDFIYDADGVLLGAVEKKSVVEEERSLCGYFVVISSEEMTARDAIFKYKGRDVSEKLFRGDKSYLGNRSLRVYSDESASAKIFVEFVALIIRSRIYVYLKEEMIRNSRKYNFMTVPASIRELEKIEIVKLLDGKYRLDHAITATQKAILKAFNLDDTYIKSHVNILAKKLDGIDNN